MKFATLFTGFGGVDIGLMAAGLSPAWGVEYDADIAGVHRRNLGDHVIVADVRGVDYAALPRADWLHASPVCTRASVANPGASEAPEDIETALAVVRAVEAQAPQVFTLENVWAYRNFAAFRLILDALGAAGYMYDFEHVNAADFGVPQTRKRLILRAVHGALLPPMPQPVPWVGWYAAIADLVDGLPDSQLAPWQLARMPEELRTVLVGETGHIQEGNRQSITTRGQDEPAMTATNSFFKTKAMLVSNAKTEYGDGMADAGDPAWSVTGNTQGRARAVLLTNGQYDGAIVAAEAGDPANTITGNTNQTSLRAVLVSKTADKFGDGHRQSFEPAQTIGANEHGSRAVLVDGNNAHIITGAPTMCAASEPAFSIPGARSAVHRAILPGVRVVAMTPRCLARFQSFPDWYELPDKRTLAAKGIGNAVPPLLMQRIAEGLSL